MLLMVMQHVDRTTVNRWALRFRASEIGKTIIEDEPRSGRPVPMPDEKHRQKVDKLIQRDRRMIQ